MLGAHDLKLQREVASDGGRLLFSENSQDWGKSPATLP